MLVGFILKVNHTIERIKGKFGFEKKFILYSIITSRLPIDAALSLKDSSGLLRPRF